MHQRFKLVGVLASACAATLLGAGCGSSGGNETPSPNPETPTATLPVTPTATAAPTPTLEPTSPTPDGPRTPDPGPDSPLPTFDPTGTPPPLPSGTPPAPTELPEARCDQLAPIPVATIQTDANLVGKSAKISGVVATSGLTFPDNATQAFFVQDPAGGDNSGLKIDVPTDQALSITPGDVLELCGTVTERGGNLSLDISQGGTFADLGDESVPAATEVADSCALAADGETLEGRLVRISDAITTDPSEPGLVFVVDGCLEVGTSFFDYHTPPLPMMDQPFHHIIGQLVQSGDGNYRLEPRAMEDFGYALFSWVTPEGKSFDESLTVTFSATDASALIYYTTDGTEPTLDSASLAVGSTLDMTVTTTLKFFAVSESETESVLHEELYELIAAPLTSLLITEVSVQGSEQEFIEIYNPTDAAVDLTHYYVTDLSNVDSTAGSPTFEQMKNEFVFLTTPQGVNGDNADFLVKFPDGTMIDPGQTLVIITAQGALFETTTGVVPDFEILNKSETIPDMVHQTKTVPTSAGLSNSQEFVLLFYWDGTSALVQDVDYIRWSDTTPGATVSNVGVNRTGMMIGETPYLADTSLAKTTGNQQSASKHSNGQSLCRVDLAEGTEVHEGGNGLDGSDETSENFSETWRLCSAYTPGTP